MSDVHNCENCDKVVYNVFCCDTCKKDFWNWKNAKNRTRGKLRKVRE